MRLRPGVRPPASMFTAGMAFVLLLTACGGRSNEDSAELASVADVENAGADTGEDAAGVIGGETPAEVDAETAFLDYAECMRSEGIDFPDPSFSADGRIERGSFQVDRSQDGFEEANDICQAELDGAALGGRGGDFRESFEQGLLAFTECIRDQGFAVDDLTLGDPGGPGGFGGGLGQGGPPDEGEGQPGQGGGGGVNRDPGQAGERLANALGLDADDPEVATAIEECQPVLTDAIGDGPPAPGDE